MRRFILVRFILPFLRGVISCLLAVFIPTVSCGDVAEAILDKTIDNLIADLRNDRFEIREAATRTLRERVEAIPSLRKARQTADLEVRRRVEVILRDLERKRALRGLSKARLLGKAGRAIEIADHLAFAAKYDVAGDEGWESLTKFADQMIASTARYFSPGWKSYCIRELPVGEFRRFAKRVNPKEIAESKIEIDTGNDRDPKDVKARTASNFIRENRGKFLLRSEEIYLTGRTHPFGLRYGMIASSGEVRVSGAMNSVIVAGGDIKKVERLTDCILICDGDVELLDGWGLRDSIIVARGKVAWKQGKLRNCLVRSNHSLLLPDGKTIDLKDGTPDPFAFVKFFELADVGLVAADDPPREKSTVGGVRLKEVRKTSPFASGLRGGDVVTAIEDKKTPTKEIFRRVLRRKLAEEEPSITFSLRRSGKTLDLPVAVKDR